MLNKLLMRRNKYGSLGSLDFLIRKELEKLGCVRLGKPDGASKVFNYKKNPLVSVVITAYNSENTIKQAIESVKNQSLKDLEIIVVDDCSTDKTIEYVDQECKKDKRVRVIKLKKNRGTYWAKNLGIISAKGSYIALQDSDDFSDKFRIEKQIEFIREKKLIACYANWVRIGSDSNVVLNRGLRERMGYPSLVFKKSLIETVGFFDVTRIAADDEFHKRMVKAIGHENVGHLKEVLYFAPLCQDSLTAKNPVLMTLKDSSNPLSFLSETRQEYVRHYKKWHESSGCELVIEYPSRFRKFGLPPNMMSEELTADVYITGSIVSIPSRITCLKQTVESVINQVDLLRVHLNGYSEVPDFLLRERIKVTTSKEYGDLRDNGKFIKTNELRRGYHLTFDDDILYPEFYVSYLILKCMQYDNSVVVGVHGTIINRDFKRYHDKSSRTTFTYKHKLEIDYFVHVLGTGTSCYHTDLINFGLDNIQSKGMVDIWLATYCFLNRIPMVCVSRGEGWIQDCDGLPDESLYKEYLNNDSEQTEIVKRYRMWERINELRNL